jgi:hypothetical protein
VGLVSDQAWSSQRYTADSCAVSAAYEAGLDEGDYLGVLDYSYRGVATDGQHNLLVESNETLTVCGYNFWSLVGTHTREVGWATLDAQGSVVNLSDWSPAGTDADGDGWPQGLGDCDDTDGLSHPCGVDDGVDRNCDGVVQLQDHDGDGEDNSIDCDDNDPTVTTTATEVPANDRDDNCDNQELCYYDSDEDGHADPFALVLSTDTDCLDAMEGYRGDDCDDTDSFTYPGAYDVLGDSVDQDCDGLLP